MKSDRITTTLGEIAEVFTGFPFQSAKYIQGQAGPRVVRGDNVKEGSIAWGDKTRSWQFLTEDLYRYALRLDDVVIGMDGSKVGKNFAAIRETDLPSVLAQRVARVRAKNGYSQALLKHLICNPEFTRYVDQVKTGTSIPHISKSQIETFPVSLPIDVAEQDAIAAVLDSIEAKAALNQRIARSLDELTLLIFEAWFVNFLPVRAKLRARAEDRDPLRAAMTAMSGEPEPELDELPREQYEQLAATAALFPDELVASEVGEVPRGWDVKPLGALLGVLETGRRPQGGVAAYSSGAPSIGAENILGVGNYDFGKTKYIPEDFFAAMKSGVVKPYDVLLYKDGGKPGDFKPRISIFGEGFPFESFAINEHVFRLRSERLGQPFLYYQLGSERVMFELAHRGAKAAIPGINQRDVRSVLFLVPPPAVIGAFERIADDLLKAILTRAKESRNLSDLRDTLLPKLLSGEFAVPTTEPAA